MKEKFLLASNNKKKLAELVAIAGEKYDVISLAQAGVESDPEESGKTFEENSYIKAYSAMKASGMPAIADDSGLQVYALNGEPGVYSARYAEINGRCTESNDAENNALLLEKMKGVQSVSGLGLMIGVKADKPTPEIISAGIERGVLFLSAKDKLRLLPPLNITYAEIDEALDVLAQILE